MITSRSAKVWAAIESRQSPRSSSLLKNATTTLILGMVTSSLFLTSSAGGRAHGAFPAEAPRVVHPPPVVRVPEGEHAKQPHLPPGPLGIVGPEGAQDVERGVLVQPLA